MMSLTTIILSILAGICLYAGINHLIIGLGKNPDLKHILFGIMCFIGFGFIFTRISLYGASSVDGYILAHRWQLFLASIFYICLLWFVNFYTSVKPNRFIVILSGLYILISIEIAIFPSELMYSDIQGLRSISLPWGDSISSISGTMNPWYYFTISMMIFLVYPYVFYASFRQYNRGEKNQALLLSLSLTIFLVSSIWGMMIRAGIFDFIYLAEYGFLALIAIMSFSLLIERRQTLSALSESEQQFRTLFTTAPIGITLSSPDGRILAHNDFIFSMTSYSADELKQINTQDIYENPKERTEILRILKIDGIAKNFETKFKRKDGSIINVSISTVPFTFSGEDALLTIFEDITERKQAVEALQESEEKFSKIFKTSPNVIIISSVEDGRIIEVNDVGVRALGMPKEELLNKTSLELGLVDENIRAQLLNFIQEQGYYSAIEIPVKLPNDEQRIGLFYGQVITVGDQKFLFQTIVDITERKQAEQVLRDSERKFSSLVKHSNVGIAVLQDNKRVFFNNYMHEMLGYTEAEYKNVGYLSIVHPDDLSLAVERIRQKSASAETNLGPAQYRFLTKSGEIRWIETDSVVIQWEGKPAIQVFLLDITNRKRAEAEINKLSKVVAQAEDIIFITDLDGNIEYVNSSFIKITGFSRDEVIGKNPRILKSGKMDAEFYRKLWHTILAGNTFKDVVINKKKDDSLFFYEQTIVPLKNENHKITHFASTGSDISERIKTEKNLKESEEQNRLLIENIPSVVWMTNSKGKTIFISNNVQKIFGYTPEDIYEDGTEIWLNRIHPEDVDTVKRGFGLLFTDNKKYEVEYRIRRKDGKWIWLYDRATTTKEIDNKHYAYGVFLDITEQKKAENALKTMAHNLGERVKELKGLYGVSQLIADPNKTLNEVFQGTVDLIFLSWQYPEITCAKITFDDKEFKTANWKKSKWAQSSDVITKEGTEIKIDVGYLEERPEIAEGPFLKEERNLIDGLARILGDFTERKQAEEALNRYQNDLKRLSAQILQTQEEERRHLSRELHDELGQELTALKIDINTVEKYLPERVDQPILDSIKEADQLVDKLIDQVHEIALDLRPTMLDDLGLNPTLTWFCKKYSKRYNVPVQLDLSGFKERLDPEIATVLYRATQEALTNIVKHAQTKNIIVELKQQKNELQLKIVDDGIGFNLDEVKNRSLEKRGSGLIGVSERISALKGTFNIKSTKQKGTQLSIILPLEEKNE